MPFKGKGIKEKEKVLNKCPTCKMRSDAPQTGYTKKDGTLTRDWTCKNPNCRTKIFEEEPDE